LYFRGFAVFLREAITGQYQNQYVVEVLLPFFWPDYLMLDTRLRGKDH